EFVEVINLRQEVGEQFRREGGGTSAAKKWGHAGIITRVRFHRGEAASHTNFLQKDDNTSTRPLVTRDGKQQAFSPRSCAAQRSFHHASPSLKGDLFMSLIDLILLLLVAGLAGAIGQSIVGYSRGGCL